MKRKSVLPIAVIDAETEGFGEQRNLKPFAWGFYDGAYFKRFWGDDATQQLLAFLNDIPPHQIFAHNGGRFDFMFFMECLSGAPLIIGNRIVDCSLGCHTLSDSFARIPVALERFGEKITIDYRKFEREKRENPETKKEILEYLERDCRLLYKVIFNWIEENGRQSSTMASAAFKDCLASMNTPKLKKRLSPHQDERMRTFYYGGRVQPFVSGVHKADLKSLDVNSMYPHVMCVYDHPLSADPADWLREKDLHHDTDFAVVTGWSKGALPVRSTTGKGLLFPSGYGTFYATGHEIRMAIHHRRFKLDQVLHAHRCTVRGDFRKFIEPVYARRMAYKDTGNIMMVEFCKLTMNGSYGKFALNPRKFKEYIFVPPHLRGDYETYMKTDGETGKQTLCILVDGKEYQCCKPGAANQMWRFQRDRDDIENSFRNVATAASITGAARAQLLDGLCRSENIVYCDTDSIICGTSHVEINDKLLGHWKNEGAGNEILIGGKKLYALLGEEAQTQKDIADRIKRFGVPDEKLEQRIKRFGKSQKAICEKINQQAIRTIKLASKGARLNIDEMRRVALGETIEYTPLAPTFNLFGEQNYIPRNIRLTNADLIKPFPSEITKRDLNGGLERIDVI
jgi:hypothetical protein